MSHKEIKALTKPTRIIESKRIIGKIRAILCCVFWLSSVSIVEATQNDTTSVSSTYECTQVAIDDIDDGTLTKQERIALLEDSLTESIDSFSSCVSTATNVMSNGGAGQGESEGEGEQGAAQSAGSAENLVDKTSESSNKPLDSSESTQQIDETIPASSNGSSPAPRGIIPPKDNDRIICKLLFQEITNTQDPDMLKGLKQQYSNYKCG